jgi:hypothetical protein
MNITQARLKELLHYDLDTGIFRWKIYRNGSAKQGKIAGTKSKLNYLQININDHTYLGHRLAWLYVYGYFPEHGIDHINRIKTDNRIKNLREVSNQCNIRNAKIYTTNKTGIKGVHWYKRTNQWCSMIMNKGKNYNLGLFNNFDNAVCARLAAEQCLDWSGCDSNSPAFQYVQKMLINKG